MVFLQSCCFRATIRSGSYASASFTLLYFGCSSYVLLQYLTDVRQDSAGKSNQYVDDNVLQEKYMTPTTLVFNIAFLICSSFMVLSSILLMIGVWKDYPQFLVPWIFFMLTHIVIELIHLVYLLSSHKLTFDPIVSLVLTIDLFIVCLDIYCLLCVISQYREYHISKERLNSRTSERFACIGLSNCNGAKFDGYRPMD